MVKVIITSDNPESYKKLTEQLANQAIEYSNHRSNGGKQRLCVTFRNDEIYKNFLSLHSTNFDSCFILRGHIDGKSVRI